MDNLEQQHNVATEEASHAVHSALLQDTPFGSHPFASASGKPDSITTAKEIRPCLIGIYLPPSEQLVMDPGPGCSWHIRPATPAEIIEKEKQRQYEDSPEYQEKLRKALEGMQD